MTVEDHTKHQPDDYSILLVGQLGYLNPVQESNLQTFKDNLIKAELYTPDYNDSGAPSHDDSTLLRFLRARKFDPVKAQKQFSDTEKWRKDIGVDKLFASFDPVEFESARRFYPRWTGRRDKCGVPVYVYRLASLGGDMSKELFAVKQERSYERIVALWEVMCRFALPLCTTLPHPTKAPICAVNTIIDLEDVSLRTMWSLRNHLQEASALATANYPETIHSISVVNSPSFFPTVWGWIKNWFDEGTRTKIHVLGRDPGPVLRSIIDPVNLPKPYGGELDWKFEDEPNLDQPARDLIGEMPKGPAIFKNGSVVKPDGTHNN